MEARSHRGAFTLVELLVTMGLMAMLATVSMAGYYSAVRGMTERGARQDVISLLRLAQQRALVDEVPNAVFLMNQTLRKENEETGAAQRIVGIAVVVRMAGRISMIRDGCLIDEYSDWVNSFSPDGSKSSSQYGMRLYRIVDGASGSSCYSEVDDYVTKVPLSTEDLVMSGIVTNTAYVYGLKIRSGGGASWKVGDPYGFEIASIQLPAGYVFGGGSLPSIVSEGNVGRIYPAKNFCFFPDKISDALGYRGSLFSLNGSIEIQAFRPGSSSPKTVETIRSTDLNDNSGG